MTVDHRLVRADEPIQSCLAVRPTRGRHPHSERVTGRNRRYGLTSEEGLSPAMTGAATARDTMTETASNAIVNWFQSSGAAAAAPQSRCTTALHLLTMCALRTLCCIGGSICGRTACCHANLAASWHGHGHGLCHKGLRLSQLRQPRPGSPPPHRTEPSRKGNS